MAAKRSRGRSPRCGHLGAGHCLFPERFFCLTVSLTRVQLRIIGEGQTNRSANCLVRHREISASTSSPSKKQERAGPHPADRFLL
jgi:hypothetical protein